VLVTGGINSGGVTNGAELYDPASGHWTAASQMNSSRYVHTATLLQNGMVLVAGGHSGAALLSSAELYNPITGIWTNTGSLTVPRLAHKAMLLPDGRVLVSGGTDNSGVVTNSSQIYDPATGLWTLTAPLNSARASQTQTLLPDGRVFVAGGATNASGSASLSSTEVFDVGLGFSNSWRPRISGLSSVVALSNRLSFAGARFRGISGSSGGNSSQDSPADYPVVQLRSIGSGQTLFLQTTNWSTNSFISTPVTNFPSGHALVTVFVNGIPSVSGILLVSSSIIPDAILLTHPVRLPNGTFQFTFTNVPGLAFTALATTNLSSSISNWINLGSAMEISSGQYQFNDPQGSTGPRRFYRVRWQ